MLVDPTKLGLDPMEELCKHGDTKYYPAMVFLMETPIGTLKNVMGVNTNSSYSVIFGCDICGELGGMFDCRDPP